MRNTGSKVKKGSNIQKESNIKEIEEEIKEKIKESWFERIRRESYPIEFLKEDLGMFDERKKPTLKEMIRGITYVRLYAKVRIRDKIIRGSSQKRLEKKYSKGKYIYTIAYMDRVLRLKGYSPDDRKRIIAYFINIVYPIMSNAGMFICYQKYQNNYIAKNAPLEKVAKKIPTKWFEYIQAFLKIVPNAK